ncbi:hypothetical protein [Blastochloris viridis]|uniref:Bacteriophage Lambda NinG protein n=1 Tax=Blastochloris viridis TaxID=1079 RepID=A0A0H5BEG3_BLAVI|nr:hypothetical protein [Blastochloris viridis]ALK09509.1 Bacteriophage Lambda NinG protein [Blastochloris viridis]BAS00606.1 hypothetical protein BV133_3012 [Blastochloris viridis]CUU42172.1 Bacteriophage Lambda NinG protein [Blastochloris viridis]
MARKHGGCSGWNEYRHGESKRPITLAGQKPKRIIRGDKREHVVASVAVLLKTFKLTPFEHEAACVQSLRSGLCLDGHRWPLADIEAAGIVAEALRRIGAERPTWNQGQREYTVPRENCRYCARPLDEEDIARNRLFCSPVCAKSALQHREFEDAWHRDKVAWSAYRLVLREQNQPRVCECCGKTFRPIRENADTRFCSLRCARESRRIDIPERACEHCGTMFQPTSANLDAKFCGKACADAAKRTLPDRACKACGGVFHPTNAGQLFCSRACADQGKKLNEVERACDWCGEGFVANRKDAAYCSDACVRFAFRVKSGRVKKISPPVFDFLMRPLSGGFACEMVAAE